MNRTTSRTSTTYSTTTVSSQSTRPSRSLWDPRTILGINSDPKCSGMKNQGTRCGNTKISGADRLEASMLLRDMARMPLSEGIPLDMLMDLAYLTLCPRWHRKPGYSQVDTLAYKWERMIDMYSASIADEPVMRRVGTRVIRNETTSATTSQTATTVMETRPPHIPREPTREIFLSQMPNPVQMASTSSTRQPSAQRNAPRPGTIPSVLPSPRPSPAELPDWSSTQSTDASHSGRRVDPTSRISLASSTNMASVATSPTSSTASRQTTAISSTTAPAPSRSTPIGASTTEVPMPSSTPPALSATPTATTPTSGTVSIATPTSPPSTPGPQQLPSPPPSPSSTRSHVHRPGFRQRLTDDSTCPICFDSITSLSTATYCSAQCGINLHRECFDDWRDTCFSKYEAEQDINEDDILSPAQRRGKLDSVTCVYCRSIWQWEWWELMNERQAAYDDLP